MNDETFALSWSKKKDGYITSAASSTICIWDVNQSKEGGSLIMKELPHGANAEGEPWTINDVRFSPLSADLIITVAEDGKYMIWDLR